MARARVRMVYGSVADFLAAQADAMSLRGRGEFRGRHGAAKDPIEPLPHTVMVCDTDDGGDDRFAGAAGTNGIDVFRRRRVGPGCGVRQP